MNKFIIFTLFVFFISAKRFLVDIDPNDRFCFYDVFGTNPSKCRNPTKIFDNNYLKKWRLI